MLRLHRSKRIVACISLVLVSGSACNLLWPGGHTDRYTAGRCANDRAVTNSHSNDGAAAYAYNH